MLLASANYSIVVSLCSLSKGLLRSYPKLIGRSSLTDFLILDLKKKLDAKKCLPFRPKVSVLDESKTHVGPLKYKFVYMWRTLPPL